MTKSSEEQDQSLTQAKIDPLRQGQRLDAIDQKPKHDSSKTEVTLDAVMLEVEGKREKLRSQKQSKADTPQAKFFSHTCNSHKNDALSKPLHNKLKNQTPPCSITSLPKNFSPLLAHAHIKPKICLNLPLKSCYAMNAIQRVYVKHSGIQKI